MKIIENVISLEKQELIKNTLFGSNFPWFFNSDVTFHNQENKTPCFFHTFVREGNSNSPHCDIIQCLIEEGIKNLDAKIKKKYTKCFLARSFLQLPLHTNYSNTDIDPIHIDIDIPHYVLLYYVMDNDAETFITKTTYNGDNQKSTNLDDHTISHVLTPKQGRMVCFDGKYYHTARQPKNNIRCIININLC